MDSHYVARLLAIGRILAGIAMLAVPGPLLAAAGMVSTGRNRLLVRMVGGRDLVLGVGAFQALASGRAPGPWVRAGAVADTVDAVAILSTADELGPAKAAAGLAVAGGAAVAGARAAADITD